MYLNIADNNFTYTQDTSTPELLLQITDASNNSITSIDGLTYKTVTDNKNTSISGFDITNKTGLINLFTNRAITTTSTKTEEWTIKITFVNYDLDQSGNAGKSFDGQILISKDPLISFFINDVTYYAKSGMTWGEWINSPFNLNNICKQNENNYTIQCLEKFISKSTNGEVELSTNTILTGQKYKNTNVPAGKT